MVSDLPNHWALRNNYLFFENWQELALVGWSGHRNDLPHDRDMFTVYLGTYLITNMDLSPIRTGEVDELSG